MILLQQSTDGGLTLQGQGDLLASMAAGNRKELVKKQYHTYGYSNSTVHRQYSVYIVIIYFSG